VVPDAGHDVAELADVLLRQGIPQQAAGHLDMAGQYAAEQGPAPGGNGDHGGAVVVGAGIAGDQAGLLQQPGLIGQAAAAVDDAVG
jgi:hypothetical protein